MYILVGATTGHCASKSGAVDHLEHEVRRQLLRCRFAVQLFCVYKSGYPLPCAMVSLGWHGEAPCCLGKFAGITDPWLYQWTFKIQYPLKFKPCKVAKVGVAQVSIYIYIAYTYPVWFNLVGESHLGTFQMEPLRHWNAAQWLLTIQDVP